MFDYLSGNLASKTSSFAVIDVNGAGYRVEIPLSTFNALPASGRVKVHTVVRQTDEEIRIYGFASERERDVFTRLIERVPGLGPTRALAILSHVGIEEFVAAIEASNVGALKKVKGIGDKLATRLVAELKGTLPGDEAEESPAARDAKRALMSLGYSASESDAAVAKAGKDWKNGDDVEGFIKRCLEYV